MKHFFTASAMLFSFLAAAQFPNLPYNPDENGDGLIGVVDLQGLLTNYGSEFSSAIVSEDGESAIVYTGLMAYYVCEHSCEQLPGFWQVVNPSELVPAYSELNVSGNTASWVNRKGFEGNLGLNSVPYYQGSNSTSLRAIVSSAPYFNNRCYCAAKQLPRVEYAYCSSSSIVECANGLVEDGWYPLPGMAVYQGSEAQAFWRWAE